MPQKQHSGTVGSSVSAGPHRPGYVTYSMTVDSGCITIAASSIILLDWIGAVHCLHHLWLFPPLGRTWWVRLYIY